MEERAMTTMNKANVKAIGSASDSTLEDVHNFLRQKSESGELPANTARNRSSALKHISSVLGENEDRDPASVLAELDDLVTRWATLNPTTRTDTVKMYQTRARSALRDFLAWKENPTGFRFKRRSVKRKPKEATVKKSATNDAGSVSPVRETRPEPDVSVNDDAVVHRGTIPINDGSDFAFSFVRGALKMQDVRRIAIMLATYAKDFNTEMPTNTQVFGIDKRGM